MASGDTGVVNGKWLLKKFLRRLLTLVYRVEVFGLDNYHQAGQRVLIVANHTSFLDPLLLGVFLPDEVTFAINTHIAQRWWLKPFLGLSTVFPMDPTHPLSLKNLIHYMQKDSRTVIFPEGRISATGSLMKIYDGPGLAADKSGAMVLPIRIEGTQYTHFSKMQRIFRLRLFPKITLQILPPTSIKAATGLSGKARRKNCGRQLADVMTDLMFKTSVYRQTIFSALLAARAVHGGKHTVVEDLARQPLSYDQLITQAWAIGSALLPYTEAGDPIGVLLPNISKTLSVVLGLQVQGRVPAMLNYAIGTPGLLAACAVADIKIVLTSRRFIEQAGLAETAAQLAQHTRLVYLEDVAQTINGFDKLKALVRSKTADLWYQEKSSPDAPAVVLFTSGSEGSPKGVVLSHSNILANHQQIASRISFTPQDVVLNFLPMFHSFGFTVGTLLPVLSGMTTFFYPTPLHFSVIPEIAYEISATILFGTNTFFAAYGKKAHSYDFYNVRYAVAGAEKLQESTRTLWAEKFGIRILEGYGVTETAPVLAVNTPMNYKAGTVGRLMPGVDYRLQPIEGIEGAGQLHVSGPNVMLGYLHVEQPGVLHPTASRYGTGWHDTGDIVAVDDEGFFSIRGRSKRFAKIAGEMVSLTVVEQIASQAWPDATHAAVSVADSKKGEQIILFTTHKNASALELASQATGVAAICLPKKIKIVDSIPLLATGKINYLAIAELAKYG